MSSEPIQHSIPTKAATHRFAAKVFDFPGVARRTNMLALVRQPHGAARLELQGIPVPRGGEALVRIALSYVCAANDRGPSENSGSLGHQAVGVVLATGSRVTSVRAGDRVFVDLPPAGAARWTTDGREKPAAAAGTHAEYTLVAEADVALVPLPPSITNQAALLVGDVGVAGLRLAAAAVRPGDRVLIYSARPNGLAAAMLARAWGAAAIIVVDEDKRRLERARASVADHTLLYGGGDLEQAMRDRGGPADVVLNAMAGTEVLDEHLACLRPGGIIAFLESACGGDRSLPFWATTNGALVISAPELPRRAAIAGLFERMSAGQLPLQSLIGRTLTLGSAQELFDPARGFEDDGLACAIAPAATAAREGDSFARTGW